MPPVAGLEAYGASGVSFNGNFVHDNYGIGIELVLVDTASASANLVHDNTGANVALDNATHVTVNQNFIYNTGETAYFTNGARPPPSCSPTAPTASPTRWTPC